MSSDSASERCCVLNIFLDNLILYIVVANASSNSQHHPSLNSRTTAERYTIQSVPITDFEMLKPAILGRSKSPMSQSNISSPSPTKIADSLSLDDDVHRRLFDSPLPQGANTREKYAVQNQYMLPHRKRIVLIARKLQFDADVSGCKHMREPSSSPFTSPLLRKRRRELGKFTPTADQILLTEWRSLSEAGARLSGMTLLDAGSIGVAIKEQIDVSFTDKQVLGRMCCLRQFFDRALDHSIRGLLATGEETKEFRYFKQMEHIYPTRRKHRADHQLTSDRKKLMEMLGTIAARDKDGSKSTTTAASESY